jgi:hypothetical protein
VRTITANAVNPGFVQTSMQEREAVWEAKLRGIPADSPLVEFVEERDAVSFKLDGYVPERLNRPFPPAQRLMQKILIRHKDQNYQFLNWECKDDADGSLYIP